MGGSRRRSKKTRPTVSMKPKRKKFTKAAKPLEMSGAATAVEKKLGSKPEWDIEETFMENYEKSNFLADPNAAFGRNRKKADIIKESGEALEEMEVEPEVDDDYLSAMRQELKGGKAPLKRLTSHQKQIITKLVEVHGDNVQAMVRDTKHNPMLHPEAKLKAMIASYNLYKNSSGVDFRVPTKRLW